MRRAAQSGGSVLFEVLVAMFLLGLLIVPLAGSLDRVQRGLQRVEDEVPALSADGGSEGWRWGGPMLRARLTSATTIEVQPQAGAPAQDIRIGLWLDGWFSGEWLPQVDGPVIPLPASFGSEVLLRARGSDGPWGSPWRLVVGPGVASGTAGLSAVTVHGRFRGPVEAGVADGSGSRRLTGQAGRLHATPVAPGRADCEYLTLTQSWSSEAGREVDLYF